MRQIFLVASTCTALLALVALPGGPADAEIGPCRADSRGGFICGEGVGAARAIDDTTSPSKRLALAWHSTGNPPTEEPSTGDLELLVIRLKDGAVLARRKTEYWDTESGAHANRLAETARWSPDSHWMVNTFEERFGTPTVDLYAFGRNDEVTGPFNLQEMMERAARGHLNPRVRNDTRYAFWVFNDRLRIDNHGLVHAPVMLWVPKDGPERDFDMTLKIMQTAGGLGAKVMSVRPARAQL
jgi:hypothetical protein